MCFAHRSVKYRVYRKAHKIIKKAECWGGGGIQRKHGLKEIIQRSGQVSLGVQQARTVLPADRAAG